MLTWLLPGCNVQETNLLGLCNKGRGLCEEWLHCIYTEGKNLSNIL